MAQQESNETKEQPNVLAANNSTKPLNLAVNFGSQSVVVNLINKLIEIDNAKSGIPKDYAYHMALIRIPSVSTNDFPKLKKYLGSFIQSQISDDNENLQSLTFTPHKCDRYTAGDKRDHNKSPIVLYPTQKESMIFKSFNKLLQSKLDMYNVIYGTNYQAGFETF